MDNWNKQWTTHIPTMLSKHVPNRIQFTSKHKRWNITSTSTIKNARSKMENNEHSNSRISSRCWRNRRRGSARFWRKPTTSRNSSKPSVPSQHKRWHRNNTRFKSSIRSTANNDTTPWQGALLQISLALGVDSGNQYFVGTMFRVNVTFSGIRLFSPPGPAETSLYDEQIKIHKTGLQNMVNTWNDLPEHCPTYGNYYYREEDKTDGSAYDEKLEKARQTLLKARKHYKQMQQQKAVSKGITKPKHKRIKSLQQNEWETILTENGEIKKKAFNVEQVDLTKKEFLTDQESEKVLQQFRNQLAEEPFYQNQMEDPEIQKIADGLYSEDPSDQTENRFPEDLMYDEQEELEKLHKHLSDNSKAKKKTRPNISELTFEEDEAGDNMNYYYMNFRNIINY